MCLIDKEYTSPYGKTFRSFAKAREHWEQERQRNRQPRSKSALEGSRAVQPEEEAVPPDSLPSLLQWLRTTAAMLAVGGNAAVERGHSTSASRARALCLDVRVNRRS